MSARKRKQAKERTRKRRLAVIIGSVVFLVFALLSTIFGTFIVIAAATEKLPNINSSKFSERAQTTKIFDRNGDLITDFYVEQDRIMVPLDDISINLQNAVIAIEDRRFYDHEGVDLRALGRAMVANIRGGGIEEGGSTLTQQLAKNTVVSWETSVRRKIREAAVAFQIEAKYSKDEILLSYLNTIFFGQSTYGAETASRTYFGKSAKELTLSEAALLAGIIRLPNIYSPYVNPEKAKERRDDVLRRMMKEEMITPVQAKAAAAQPIKLVAQKTLDYPFPYFVEYIKQQMLNDSAFGSTVTERTNTLFKGGLRIYTTIDPKMQSVAEDAVWGALNQPGDPAGSLVAIEPSSGYVRAMVGGNDWQSQKFNYAVQALRQPGSAFKPFVLAAALENDISISKTYPAGSTVIKLPSGNWEVKSSGSGHLPLREATIRSVNSVFARLIMDIGPTKVVEQVKKMGIESRIEALPAIALGGLGRGVTPLEMATAYSTFANSGQHAKTIAITKVTDSDGKVLKTNKVRIRPAMDPVTAYLVTDALRGVIQSGTGRSAGIGRPAAGKTGTTENNGDAWFVGYTPDLAASVWVGYPDSRRPMTNVHGITVQGGTFPAQIWGNFMSRALAGTPATNFVRPAKGVVGILICNESGDAATEFCPDTSLATYAQGSGPAKLCELHTGPVEIDMPNIINLPGGEAKSILEAAGLRVRITEIDTLAVPQGQVASQKPVAGTKIEEGAEIDIQVSTGKPATVQIEVPKVVGFGRGQGESLVKDAGLAFNIVWVPVSGPGQVDMIVGQLPPAGTIVKPGVEVILKVGQAPKPSE